MGLAGGDGKPGINHYQLGTTSHCLTEVLHLRVVHVFTQVGAEQHDQLAVRKVKALRRTDALAKGEFQADVTRTTALGKGWHAHVL